ncbi:MAG: hypothetical protein K8R58_04330 [Bacteroidales bacterium]|nr:hypothetical protein [Bacteroidales bacterium]
MNQIFGNIKTFFIRTLEFVFRFQIHHDFVRLFIKKEGKELLGKKYKNFWYLTAILFITFVAIGFANGSLDYLAEKMDDPFVKNITIEIPSTKNSKIGQIKYELNNDSILKQKYGLNNIKGFNNVFLSFFTEDNKDNRSCRSFVGRTIEIDDPLLEDITGKKNLIIGRSFKNYHDIGLIVTEDFLEKLNYPENLSHALLSLPIDPDNNIDTIVPLPIIAVVKALPGLNYFAVTQFFYSQKRLSYGGNPFNPIYTKSIKFFINEDSVKCYEFRDEIKNIFNNNKFKKYDPEVDIYSKNDSYRKGYVVQISLQNIKHELLQVISNEIKSIKKLEKYNYIQVYNFSFKSNNVFDKYDYLTVNFSNLDKIRDFQEYLSVKYNLGVDMSQIESRENYNFITKLTRILSFLLIFFSILSICMLVSNILTRHLEKIHMNIGTFKAFGINNLTLQKIYIIIIYVFVFVSIIISLFLSWIFGLINGCRILLKFSVLDLEANQTYYNLFDMWTFGSIAAIFIVGFFISYRSANKILKKTPGDLIYSREKNKKSTILLIFYKSLKWRSK